MIGVRIGIIQAATVLGEPERNKEILAGHIERLLANPVDVLIFPETWNVGFIPENVSDLAEEEETSESLAWMKDVAQKHQVNIVGGSIIMKTEGHLVNRSYILNRQGEVIFHYDKIHLFSPGKESDYFVGGRNNQVFELDGVPCAVQICYDLRFPELARKLALAGAKVLFTPAQWPHQRMEHWRTLNKARAIENQLFVICVNGSGYAGSLKSCGHSMVISPWGEEVLLLGEDEAAEMASIDLQIVEEVRSKIPVFKDRLPQFYT